MDLALQFKAQLETGDVDTTELTTGLTTTLEETYGTSAVAAATWIREITNTTTDELKDKMDGLGVKIVETTQTATPQIKAMMQPVLDAAAAFNTAYVDKSIEIAIHETITRTIEYEMAGTGPRQHGGPVRRGMSYIVGEAGPEMFIPEGNGRIIDAGRTESMINSHNQTGGTVNIEQIINNNGLDDRAALLQIKRLAGL